MKKKICSTCKIEKKRSEFYRKKAHKDGLTSQCKSCVNECNKIYREKHKQELSEKAKIYFKTPKGKESHRKSIEKYNKTEKCKSVKKKSDKKYKKSNPKKHRAHWTLQNAVRYGKIKKPKTCSICGKECLPHGHHTDYSKPLDVIWCCPQCHVNLHKQLKEVA